MLDSKYTESLLFLLFFGALAQIFSSTVNLVILDVLSSVGIATGSIYSNAWVAGVTEPLSSKLLGGIIIGLFAKDRYIRYFVISMVAGAPPLFLLGNFGPELAVFKLYIMISVPLLAVTVDVYNQSKTLDFNDLALSYPYLFGALAGGVVGFWELCFYVLSGREPLWMRIPTVFLHTLTGFLVVGVLIDTTGRTISSGWKWSVVGLAVFGAILFHVWWNSWLVNSEMWSVWHLIFTRLTNSI